MATKRDAAAITGHKVVEHAEWLRKRKALLRKEKEFTRLRDELSRARRALPWERVEKSYEFTGPDGREKLEDLFDDCSQLVVYHFMFGPDWEAGCPHCSHWADNFNGGIVHLAHRDLTLVAVSRAPYQKLAAYKNRMRWDFKWVSSDGSDFNFDFGVSFTSDELARKKAFFNYVMQDPGVPEREGVSVFYRNKAGRVFHTYSAYARGIDLLNTDYNILDLVPKGRDEHGRGPFWVRRHDEYGD